MTMSRTWMLIVAAVVLTGCGAAEGPARRTGAALDTTPAVTPTAVASATGGAAQNQEQRCADLAAAAAGHGLDAADMAGFIGTYAPANNPEGPRRWSVDLVCAGRVLQAVPLWGDVAPPWLKAIGQDRFDDDWGVHWKFQRDAAGSVTGVELDRPGEQPELYTRTGPPQDFG